MTNDLQARFDDLLDDQPPVAQWSQQVRRRIARRRRQRLAVTGSALALAGAAAFTVTVPGEPTTDVAVLPPATELELVLDPATPIVEVGKNLRINARARDPKGSPLIGAAAVNSSRASLFRPCSEAPSVGPGEAERAFDLSFDRPGSQTVTAYAVAASCEDEDVETTGLIEVVDPLLELTNEIGLEAKVVQQPIAGVRDLILAVTYSGSRVRPRFLSGMWLDGDALFIGDRCAPGVKLSGEPGTRTETFTHRYDQPGPDRILLLASTYCTEFPGRARLELNIEVLAP